MPDPIARIELPKGVILAWYHRNGDVPPAGWTLCDGNNGAPDLNGRFLRGVTHTAEVGGTGGQESHRHGIGKGNPDGNGWEGKGPDCMLANCSTENNLPPFMNVQYIMKTA
jgi:hypothetical protein